MPKKSEVKIVRETQKMKVKPVVGNRVAPEVILGD